MDLSKIQMPRDAHDAPIPVLAPRIAHTLSVTAATQGDAIPLDTNTRALFIETDTLVYYAFGDATVTANSNSFQRSANDYRVIGVPNGATYIRFFGGSSDAAGYMEEM